MSQKQRVLLLSQGSRGDCQPFVALASSLKAVGFDTMVLTNPEEESLCRDLGVQFASNTVPFKSFFVDSPTVKAFTSNNFMNFIGTLDKFNAKHVANLYETVWDTLGGFRPDLVVCGTQHWHDVVWIPILFRVPALAFNLSNSHTLDPYKAPFGLPSLPFGMNACIWNLVIGTWVGGYKPAVELLSSKCGKPKASFWPTVNDLHGVFGHFDTFSYMPYCICQDEEIHGRKSTDRPWFVYTGGLIVRPEKCLGKEFGGDEEAGLERFLAAGAEPPVYIGWGSVTCSSGADMSAMAVRALMLAGARGVVLGGWSGVSAACLQGLPDEVVLQKFCSSNVLFVKTASHERLFPRCAAIVHHGGSGTTLSGIRSGRPNIVTPIFYDQFDNAKLVAQSGQGIALGHLNSLKPEDLAAAIKKCLTDTALIKTAKELGQRVGTRDGTQTATEVCAKFLREDVASGKYWTHFDDFASKKQRSARGSPWFRPWCCGS